MRQQGKMRFHSSFRSIVSVLEKCPASSLSNGRWPGRLSRCIVIDASSAMWRWVNRCERMPIFLFLNEAGSGGRFQPGRVACRFRERSA